MYPSVPTAFLFPYWGFLGTTGDGAAGRPRGDASARAARAPL